MPLPASKHGMPAGHDGARRSLEHWNDCIRAPKGMDAGGEVHTGERDRDDAELGLQELGDKLKTPEGNRHNISTFDAL